MLPLPAGYTTRTASLEDVEIAAQAGCEYAQATIGGQDLSAENLYNQWQLPGFNPATDIYFVFSPQHKLVGYSGIWAIHKPPIHPWVWGLVDVQHQGLGLGTHMLTWADRRLAQVIENVPVELRFAPQAGTFSTIQPARQLLENNGWRQIRSTYQMRIDLDSAPPAPQFPANLTIRTFRAGDTETLYRAKQEAFRDHFGFVPQPFDLFKQRLLGDPAFDAGLWFLAWAGDELAGFCLGFKHSDDDPQAGFVVHLGVRRPWRKQGLGLALLRQAFGEFHRRGCPRATLGVDAENLTGALRLYEKAGMYVNRCFDTFEKEIRLGAELSVQAIEEQTP